MSIRLICGVNPVLEGLAAGERHFERLLVVKGLRNRRVSEAITRATRLGIPLRFEPRETLDRMAGSVPHQGIMAVVSAKPLLSVEEVLERAHDPALLVVLDGVEDPRNLGAILRTAEAAGADGVLLPERRSAGLSETVARASAGALEHVRVAQVGNVAQALETLKARGVWVIGFDAGGQERWDRVDLRRPVALVLGGEGRGMRRLVRERCDHLVALPLFGHVGSLNVSVAAGIALYEAIRQRGVVPSQVRPIPPKPAEPQRRVVGPAAGDGEHDPGAFPAGAGEDDAEAADEPETVVLLHDEPDPAWWSRAAKAFDTGVERHARHVGGGRERGRGRGRPGRRRGRRPDAPRQDVAPPTQPAATGAPHPAGPDQRPRPRRRRRKRGWQGPQGAPPQPQQTGSPPASGTPPPGDGGPGAPPAPERQPHPGRRRRRRRRR